MEPKRLSELYDNPALVSDSDIDMLEKLAGDHPYYHKPFVVLAKAYFDKKHYRFEESLRQAAIRVKSREWLYEYIHSGATPDVAEPYDDTIIAPVEEAEPAIKQEPETVLPVSEAPIEVIVEQLVEERVTLVSELPGESIIPQEPEISIVEEPVQEVEFRMPEILGEGTQVTTPEKEPEIAHFTIEFAVEDGHEEPVTAVEEEPQVTYGLKDFLVDDDAGDTITETVAEDLPEPFLKPHTEAEPTPQLDFFSWLAKTTGEEKDTPSVAEPVLAPSADAIVPDTEPVTSQEEIKDPPAEVQPPPKKKSLSIIEQFITQNPSISRPKKEFFSPENMAKRSEQIDLDIVTETLAAIYYEHGSYDLAIAAYEKLSLQNPGKEAYFASLIEKIKQQRK